MAREGARCVRAVSRAVPLPPRSRIHSLVQSCVRVEDSRPAEKDRSRGDAATSARRTMTSVEGELPVGIQLPMVPGRCRSVASMEAIADPFTCASPRRLAGSPSLVVGCAPQARGATSLHGATVC